MFFVCHSIDLKLLICLVLKLRFLVEFFDFASWRIGSLLCDIICHTVPVGGSKAGYFSVGFTKEINESSG
jgi:hypothetical protein